MRGAAANWTSLRSSARWRSSAADLKFLGCLLQTRIGPSNPKPHYSYRFARVLLIPKFAQEPAAWMYELRNRDTRFSGADVTGTAAAKSRDAIFAANRAVGSITLSVKNAAGRTRRDHVHEEGSLRVRCPGSPGRELEAVIINTAGGAAGGD